MENLPFLLLLSLWARISFLPPQCRFCCLVAKSCLTLLRLHGLSMGFPDQNTGVGCHFLLQGIFLTQGSNLRLLLSLLHCRQFLYPWSSGWGSLDYFISCNCLKVNWTNLPCLNIWPESLSRCEVLIIWSWIASSASVKLIYLWTCLRKQL